MSSGTASATQERRFERSSYCGRVRQRSNRRRFTVFCTLAICAGLVVTFPALAAAIGPSEQLRLMAQSLRTLDYEGAFIFQSGSRVDTFHIAHSGDSSGVDRERLTRLSGPSSVVTRNGDSTTVRQPGQAPLAFPAGASARLLPLVPVDAAALPNPNYRLRMGEIDRVAGYDCSVIDIVAADAYRYSYRVWLDRQHHLPLRVSLLDDSQRTVEQYMFVQLSVGSAAAVELGAIVEAVAMLAAEKPVGSAGWTVNDLPQGFLLRSRHSMPSVGTTREQLILSDGLAIVSAYIEPTPEPISEDVALARGAMNVYIHHDRGWRFTVLGNVPSATVQRIAVSISAVPGTIKPN